MALDCSDVPSNTSYNCETPWGQNCTSAKHFDFGSLWNYTLHIQEACANDSRLFLSKGEPATRQNAALNQASCVAIAGSDWTRYPTVDIWTRLTTWKFPLIQLVAAFPRPPLSLGVECFVIIHLLGDPIDTMKNLLLKLSSCQYWVHYWRALSVEPVRGDNADSERHWKALALLTDAYGEWGRDTEASRVLQEILDLFEEGSKANNTLKAAIYQIADALAADRATKFLPIIIALSIYIGTVGIAVGRTASAGAFSQKIFINVEAHGIANSALYFWVIPAVFLSSVIGVSQTQAAIPRILRRLQNDLPYLPLHQQERVEALNECLGDHERRKFSGGIYSWQPARWQWMRSAPDSHYTLPRRWFADEPLHLEPSSAERDVIISTSGKWNGFALSAYLFVIIGTMTGMTISGLVPPDGLNCRHIGQLLTCIAWTLSAGLDTIFDYIVPMKLQSPKLLLKLTLTKDVLITIATVAWVIVLPIGFVNRCACYTMWGRAALALPEMPQVAEKLNHRIRTAYPGVAFASIIVELIVIPSMISFRYSDALRVFIQRDDGVSNRGWLRKAWRRVSDTRWFWKLRRGRTLIHIAEEGGPNDLEVQANPNRANEIVRRRAVGRRRVRTI